MLASWMLYCVAVGVLLSAGAAALERGLRSLGRPTRWAWVGATALTLALPVAARMVPAAPLTPEPTQLRVTAVAGESPDALPARTRQAAPLAFDLARWDAPLRLAWGGSSLAVVVALCAMGAVLARRRRAWSAAEVDGVPVLVSTDTGPAVVGLVRSRIVLPAWALRADDEARRLVLEHEQEHVRAGDPRLLAAALLAAAVMPWNPAVWWQLRRLRLAVEVDCDARVLRRRGDVHAYGSVLLEMGRRARRTHPAPAAAFAEPVSTLERRIRIMTASPVRRPLLRAAGFGAVAATLLVVACEAPQPTQPSASGPSFSKTPMTPEAAVAQYFPDVAKKGMAPDDILLFVVAPDGEMLRHAWIRDAPDPTTPIRGAGDPRLRPLIAPFSGMMSRVSLVQYSPGELGPTGSQVMWVQLRRRPGTPRPAAADPRDDRALHDAVRRHYTVALRDAGVLGQVGVSFAVGADGKARDVQVADGADPRLAEAARAVVADLTFTPTQPGEMEVMMIPFLPERRPAPAAAR
jgi:beta-lactamase regulating signal transducer with metallopeptidase domain